MKKSISLRKILLITVIVALCVSAFLGIGVFVSGKFGNIEIKTLLTTSAVGGFSLTGLCCSVLLEKGKYKSLAISGVIISILALLFSFDSIWDLFNLFGDQASDVFLTLCILAFSMAHVSLILLIDSYKTPVTMTVILTVVFIAIVAFMLILDLVGDNQMGDSYFRLLGVFAILDVLGTIVTPILNKVYRD